MMQDTCIRMIEVPSVYDGDASIFGGTGSTDSLNQQMVDEGLAETADY